MVCAPLRACSPWQLACGCGRRVARQLRLEQRQQLAWLPHLVALVLHLRVGQPRLMGRGRFTMDSCLLRGSGSTDTCPPAPPPSARTSFDGHSAAVSSDRSMPAATSVAAGSSWASPAASSAASASSRRRRGAFATCGSAAGHRRHVRAVPVCAAALARRRASSCLAPRCTHATAPCSQPCLVAFPIPPAHHAGHVVTAPLLGVGDGVHLGQGGACGAVRGRPMKWFIDHRRRRTSCVCPCAPARAPAARSEGHSPPHARGAPRPQQ